MPTTTVDFDQPTFVAARFTTVCAVGRSVRAHLRHLFKAAHRKSDPNWAGVIDSINTFLDGVLPVAGSSQDATDQIEIARSTITNLAIGWRTKNPELHDTITSLAGQIRPFKPGELNSHLVDLYEQGLTLARKCASDWGGNVARKAVSLSSHVELDFATEDGVATYATCDRIEEENGFSVRLIIGNGPDLLKTYLSLEFYFFHECLSHVFPAWEDLSGRLSEGYLYSLEKAFFRANCHLLKHGFSLHSLVIDDDMAAHRRRAGKKSGELADLEGLYVWLDNNCKPGVLPRLLLDISAMPNARPNRLPEKLLAQIEFVASQQDNTLADILSENDNNPHGTYEALKARILPFGPPFRTA